MCSRHTPILNGCCTQFPYKLILFYYNIRSITWKQRKENNTNSQKKIFNSIYWYFHYGLLRALWAWCKLLVDFGWPKVDLLSFSLFEPWNVALTNWECSKSTEDSLKVLKISHWEFLRGSSSKVENWNWLLGFYRILQ